MAYSRDGGPITKAMPFKAAAPSAVAVKITSAFHGRVQGLIFLPLAEKKEKKGEEEAVSL